MKKQKKNIKTTKHTNKTKAYYKGLRKHVRRLKDKVKGQRQSAHLITRLRKRVKKRITQ